MCWRAAAPVIRGGASLRNTAMHRLALLVLAPAALLLGACGSSEEKKSPAASGTTASATKTVTIQDFRYRPAELNVSAGTKVTWTNRDRAPHTVTGKGIDLDDLTSGRSASFTFDMAGTYAYVCSFHPFMKGRVVVG